MTESSSVSSVVTAALPLQSVSRPERRLAPPEAGLEAGTDRAQATGDASCERHASDGAVTVVDDMFDASVQASIAQLLERPKWSFTGGTPQARFWHMDHLEDEAFFSTTLLALIRNRLGSQLRPSVDVVRIYANGQTASQSGSPHTDDGDVTLVYFSNLHWRPEWEGSLAFEDGDFGRVEYTPNRLVVFPARLKHFATAPSKHYAGMRVSLTFKLQVQVRQQASSFVSRA